MALIDDEDHPMVSQYKWRLDSHHRYAVANAVDYAEGKYCRIPKRKYMVRMHRLLMPDAPCVDHIDGNGLNNQRSNLRSATKAQNGHNTGPYRRRGGKTSKYKGVSRGPRGEGWVVEITENANRHYVGYFTDEEAAAQAWDQAALLFHGEFAYQNFPLKSAAM